jgi:hypothetical protein
MAVYVCSVVLLDNIESWMFLSIEEEFEDTKGLIGIRKTKDRQHNYQKKKKDKGQTTIYKTLHRKLKIE